MSLGQSHQTSSPSFPSIEQVSGDIFFQVKKQILDKLDIILQKVNLQVIEYLKPQIERKQEKKNFRFIELSSFEKEIQTLFDYLDRLYESLNSSISFSSNDIKNTLTQSNGTKTQSVNQFNSVLVNEINEMKIKFQQLGEQTLRLRQENEHMKFLIKANLSNSISLSQSVNQQSKSSLRNNSKSEQKSKDSVRSNNSNNPFMSDSKEGPKSQASQNEGISLQTVRKILRFYNHSIRQLSLEYKQSVKEIKKLLKQAKFQIIQNRVQCIAQLKKWSQKRQGQFLHDEQQDSIRSKSKIQKSPTFQAKANSISQSQQQEKQSLKSSCNQQCFKRHYENQEQKNGFQQSILDKIQQILDVC